MAIRAPDGAKKKEIANSVQPPNIEATLSKLRNWEIQNDAKLAEQIKEMAKYKKTAKIAETKMQEKPNKKKARKGQIQKMQNTKEMQNLLIQMEEKATW